MKFASLPAVCLLLSACLLGCSGGGSETNSPLPDGGTPPDSGAPPDSGPPPDASEIRFDTSTYTLKPGEEMRYLCFTTRLPGDAATIVNEIVPLYGKATHHLGIYYTLTAEPDGAFDCPELVRETWVPLYGGGAESGTLKAPEGAGFHLPKGQQILVQLHLLNAGSEPVSDKATIVFKTTDDKNATAAGMFGFDNRQIHIPAHTSDVVQTMSCPNVDVDMDVFAVFGHMHQLGKHIEVSRGAQPGDELLFEEGWNFDNQPTVPKSFHISKTDTVHVRCTYDNPSDADFAYGESTFDEMCSFVFYYTPYTSLNGCVQSATP